MSTDEHWQEATASPSPVTSCYPHSGHDTIGFEIRHTEVHISALFVPTADGRQSQLGSVLNPTSTSLRAQHWQLLWARSR